MSSPSYSVHIIHVGNMSNKGTEGLLKSDLSVIRDVIVGDVNFAVTTTDIEGVRRLNLGLKAVFPPMVDIPYERADYFARKSGYERSSWRYKASAIASLVFMLAQAVFSVGSAVLVKAGLKSFYRSKALEYTRDSSIVVSCSGENYKEASTHLSLNFYWIITWWSMLFSRAWQILVAKFFGKPVVVLPNSVGPFRTSIGRFLSRLALNNCDVILVRDLISFSTAMSLGVKSPKILTSDTTLMFGSFASADPHLSTRPLMGVSAGIYGYAVSEGKIRKYVFAHAKAIDRAVERHGFSVIFSPHYTTGLRYDDLEICKMILGNMKNKGVARIVHAKTTEEFKSLLGQMDIVVSSKMHPAVLATTEYVPTLCIVYDQKQTGYFSQLNLPQCLLLFQNVSEAALLSKIEEVWGEREEIRARLKERIPQLQQVTKKAIKQALTHSLKLSH